MTTRPKKPTTPRAPAVFEIETLETAPAPQPESLPAQVEPTLSDPDWEIGPAPTPRKKRFSFVALLISTVTFLATLAGGLWLENLIGTLFARHEILGYLATGLTALAALAARRVWWRCRRARSSSR